MSDDFTGDVMGFAGDKFAEHLSEEDGIDNDNPRRKIASTAASSAGAAMGFAFGGPIGALIGGFLGGALARDATYPEEREEYDDE